MKAPNIPDADYERLERLITSEDSPVGIDARKAHVIILYKLEQLEKRLAAVEHALDLKPHNGWKG